MGIKRRHLLMLLVAGIITSISLAIAYLLLFGQPASAPKRNTAQTETTDKSPKEEDDIMVSLPGAKPIRAIHEDYTHPSSLWVVVAKKHPLKNVDYVPNNLAKPPVATNTQKTIEEQSLRNTIFNATEELFADAKQNGHELFVASGYRSYDLQQMYYSNYVRVSGEAEADKYSAKPGTSEHQTGIAFDISTDDRKCYLETCFGESQAGKWLASNAHKYGFILRYPEDKTSVTGYQYEPWHFRFVGKDMAGALKDSGLTLDEALPHLQKAYEKLKEQKVI